MANSCCFALYCVNPLLCLDFIVIFVVKKGVSMLRGGIFLSRLHANDLPKNTIG